MSTRTTNLAPSAADRRSFVLRKLHSLSGVVPVGVFLVFHLWTNAKAMQGKQVFEDAVRDIHKLPYLLVIEIVFIYLPLLYHALYGIAISFEARPNVGRYPYSKNWSYVLQRVTGLLTFAFVAFHLWQFRIQVALGKMEPRDFFGELCSSLSSTTSQGIPLVAAAYLIGIAAAAYHLCNGLTGFCFSWGITVSRRATRVTSAVFGVAGILLFVFGANTVIYFATGSALVLSPDRTDDSASTCVDLAERGRLAVRPQSPGPGR